VTKGLASQLDNRLLSATEVVRDAFQGAQQKLDQFRQATRVSTWLIRHLLHESLVQIRRHHLARAVRHNDKPGF